MVILKLIMLKLSLNSICIKDFQLRYRKEISGCSDLGTNLFLYEVIVCICLYSYKCKMNVMHIYTLHELLRQNRK